MLLESNMPSTVMFEMFKDLGIKHIRAAEILFNLDFSYGGTPIRDRLKKRTELSRQFVHAEPGKFSETFFSDFYDSAQKISSMLLESHSCDTLMESFRGEAAESMMGALQGVGQDPAPYRNALKRIDSHDYPVARDRLTMYLILFIVCGCLGDVRRAASIADECSERRLGTVPHTVVAQQGTAEMDDELDLFDNLPIGIIRIFSGMTMKAEHPLHVLSPDAVTTIGSGDCDITDVDEQVSRKHARIWKEGGRWFIEGLKSTNGITIISGEDKTVQVVEPPRTKRPFRYTPVPHEILPADTICLGETTRYLVQLVNTD